MTDFDPDREVISYQPWGTSHSDPIADLRAGVQAVYEQTGYETNKIFLSARDKTAFENSMVWFAEMERYLELTPRRRFITRIVIKRMMWGPWYKRGRIDRIRVWWKLRKYDDVP